MSQALTEAEIERLAIRLSRNTNPGALSLEAVDGLFCALIASPALVMPSQYLPVILAGDPEKSPAFADSKDATDTLSLLIRYWNSTAEDFRNGDHLHLPYLQDPATDDIPGRDWARGFMRGTRLAAGGWDRLFKDDEEGMAIAIPLVAGEIDPEWPKEPLSAAKSDELLQWMFASAARAYRYFEADRRELAQQGHFDGATQADDYLETYVRPERKTGRNVPCPCGSGKKFKKCCGSPDRGPAH